MTISLTDNNPRISYTVNAGVTQTSFTVPFEFFDIADLNVYVDGTQKSATTHYTVSSGGSGSTGTIALSVTGASGNSTVVITRDIDLARTTDFPTSGSFNIAALNTELDKVTAQFADGKDDVDRSLRLQDSDAAASMELPLKDARKGTVLGFNATTGVPEAGPTIANVNSLSAITTNINTVAGISSNVTTVAGISSNVTTVAGIASNVTSVAGNASNINAAVSNASNINTVAGNISNVNAVGAKSSLITSDFVSDLNTVAVTDVINDLNTLATSDFVADLNLAATSDFISDLNTMATTTNVNNLGTVAGAVSNVNTVAGIASNVSTVAGIASNVTAVAGDATDIGNVSDSIGNVNTVAGAISNVNSVAGNASNINSVAGNSSNINSAVSNASNINSAVSNASNINTVAGAITNVNNVGGSIANVNTVATNLSGVNSFAERYRVGSSDPTTSLDEGDLAYNSTDNALKFYNGSSWNSITAGIGNVVEDTSPQLGGALDVQTHSIVSTSNRDITIDPNGTGDIVLDAKVGIGTAAPDRSLHIAGSEPSVVFENTGQGTDLKTWRIYSNSSSLQIGTVDDAFSAGQNALEITRDNTDNITGIQFKTSASSESMRLTSAGRLGISTSNPLSALHVAGGVDASPAAAGFHAGMSGNYAAIEMAGSDGGFIDFQDATDGNDHAGRIIYGHSDDKMIFSAGGAQKMSLQASGPEMFVNQIAGFNEGNGNTKISIAGNNANTIEFFTNGSEKMRVSGTNLSVGTTTTDIYDSTSETGSVISDGYLAVARASSVAYFNRLSSDGKIVDFRKNASVIGEIRTYGGDLAIGTNNVGLRFIDSTDVNALRIVPSNIGSNTDVDASLDLGMSSARFRDGYFSNQVNANFIQLGASGSSIKFETSSYYLQGSATNGYLRFVTSDAERARFDASGNFMIAGTSSVPGLGNTTTGSVIRADSIVAFSSSSGYLSINRNSDGTIQQFNRSGNTRGSITTTSSGTTYNTTSDIRLKQDIEPLVATDKLMAMNPVSYAWKADPDGPRSMGFIAQEMEEVMPDAVSTSDDDEAMMSMDYGRITPILVSALQDAHRKIEQLEQRLADMEAN